MNILIVASPWLGGSGTVGYELAEALSVRHNVYFISFDFPYRQPKGDHLLLINTVPATYSLFSYPLYQTSLVERIVQVVKRFDIDLVHAHYSIVFGETAIIAKKILESEGKKLTVVLTFHGSDAVGFSPETPGSQVFLEVNKWLISEADAVTTPTHWMANFISKIYGTTKEIVVVPNFFDKNIFRKTVDWNDRKNFIHVSNFRKVKRPFEVVKAFEAARPNLTGIKLLMVGEGPEIKSVKEYVIDHSIEENIVFMGAISKEDLSTLYNQSLALILPSTFENFPLTILEANACGTPAIVSNVGGLVEAVIDAETGYRIKNISNPAEEIVQGILAITSSSVWSRLSRAALEFVEQFAKERIVPQYEALYQRTLNI